jgi:hypothetical protein
MGLPGWGVDTPAKIAMCASLEADLAVVHCCDFIRNGENLLRKFQVLMQQQQPSLHFPFYCGGQRAC